MGTESFLTHYDGRGNVSCQSLTNSANGAYADIAFGYGAFNNATNVVRSFNGRSRGRYEVTWDEGWNQPRRIVSPLGRRIDEQQPIVNARLPQGHRVNAVIPPISLKGTTVTIRKFREVSFTLSELVENGTMSQAMAQLLVWAVLLRENIAVSGGTGGGKTTLDRKSVV